jgi:hypothetical protein
MYSGISSSTTINEKILQGSQKKKKRFQFDQTRFCLGFKTLRPNGGQLEMMCTAVMAFVVMMGERG